MRRTDTQRRSAEISSQNKDIASFGQSTRDSNLGRMGSESMPYPLNMTTKFDSSNLYYSLTFHLMLQYFPKAVFSSPDFFKTTLVLNTHLVVKPTLS